MKVVRRVWQFCTEGTSSFILAVLALAVVLTALLLLNTDHMVGR